MNEHELPDDIKQLEKLYRTPEEEIERLEQIISHQSKRILEQANDMYELQGRYNKLLAHTQDLTDNIQY